MYALTIHQPYASLIVAGIKRFEFRNWDTNVRGPIFIHAGRVATSRRLFAVSEQYLNKNLLELPRHAIIGTASIHDIEPAAALSPLASLTPQTPKYLFRWHLTNAQQFPDYFPWKGKPSLWRPPEELLAEIDNYCRQL